nr:polyunsaturated fatty acid 5-lipoxygenase-like [Lytechinus pictus]
MGNQPSKKKNIVVYVKTGERIGMGTDDNVFVVLHDENGQRTRKIKLDNLAKNDFESGQLDSFSVAIENEDFGDPAYLELRRDKVGLHDDEWYCEFVRVLNENTQRLHMFPIHRWVRDGYPIKVNEHDAVLPQDDENIVQRQEELKRKRAMYTPKFMKATGMIMVENLPKDETFSISHQWDLKSLGMKLKMENRVVGFTTERFESLQDMEEIYKPPHFPKPHIMDNWKSDKEFGNQRLSGCNPTVIRLCTKIPSNFALDEKEVEPLLEGLTIPEAITKKRLFIIDHKLLQDLPCTDGRKICAPLCLFFVNNAKYLMPVAIQLNQVPAPNNPVFYPTDPEYTWLLAKCFFNLADAAIHESGTHLGFTHLIGEIVVIATHRSLSPSHPIFRLLAPHFMYLVAINNKGMAPLLGKGNFTDENMIIGATGMAEIIKRTYATWRLDVEGSLETDLLVRGVSDPEVLPNYHYRDDALLLREAISDYVKEVVDHYYDHPRKIAADTELQEWIRFIGTKPRFEGEIIGHMKGLPNDGEFKSAEEIATVVTDFIFIYSAGHAASNFGQYNNYGFPPAYPIWMNGSPPEDKTPRSEADIVEQLPNKKQTLDIMAFMRLLSTRGSKPLADFEVQYMHGPAYQKALKKFRAQLKRISDIIDQRNEEREEKYLWLHPREVPNSITI